MTNAPSVEVMQADREAARPLWCGWWRNMKPDKIAEFAEDGLLDGHDLIQAFTRHRLQSTSDLRAKAEGLAEVVRNAHGIAAYSEREDLDAFAALDAVRSILAQALTEWDQSQ